MIRSLPLFPLPGVVLLPETLLPLHIFEDRYRAMVSDALQGDRTIGMAMWKPAPPQGVERPEIPEIFPVGGAGEIGHREGRDAGSSGGRQETPAGQAEMFTGN